MKVDRTDPDNARHAIREKIRDMGDATGRTLRETVDAFDHLDFEHALAIIKADESFNRLNESIHDDCLTLIARQQPVASGLREIIAGLQIAVELERIADHAADIARIIRLLEREGIPPVWDEILTMVDHCEEMLTKMLVAFCDRDPIRAEVVAAMDDDIDRMNGQIVSVVIRFMQMHSEAVANGTRLIWLVHNLERIGDRITNIGEHILFAASGKSVDWNRS